MFLKWLIFTVIIFFLLNYTLFQYTPGTGDKKSTIFEKEWWPKFQKSGIVLMSEEKDKDKLKILTKMYSGLLTFNAIMAAGIALPCAIISHFL